MVELIIRLNKISNEALDNADKTLDKVAKMFQGETTEIRAALESEKWSEAETLRRGERLERERQYREMRGLYF